MSSENRVCRRHVSLRIRELYGLVSPLIERVSERVCPSCDYICCRERHFSYDLYDRIFLEQTGLYPTGMDTSSECDEDTYCRMLSENGCLLPRWQRPFRCTWFFCDTMISEMGEDGLMMEEIFGIIRELQQQRVKLRAGGGCIG